MTDFSTHLQSISTAVDGVIAVTLMGNDGIPVEAYEPATNSGGELDVSSLLIEYSSLIAQVQRSAQMFAAGGLEELSIASERLTTIIRPVTSEYFLALAMRANSNVGKGRYLLRIHAPKLASQLS
jgi:predicted regulator of Ras-like GTPase activity (Roadblock/LC7/MglB family)